MNNESNNKETAKSSCALFLPSAELSGCIFAFILRDTRHLLLKEHERINRFPASPLCAITWIFEGESHLISLSKNNGEKPSSMQIPSLSFSGPLRQPVQSFNPDKIFALTLGFYPDAFQAITGQEISPYIDRTVPLNSILSGDLLKLFETMFDQGSLNEKLQAFENELELIWQQTRPKGHKFTQKLQDWSRLLAIRALTSKAGQSVRQIQRRTKDWTGQNQRELIAYSKNEALFENWLKGKEGGNLSLAELAAENGFSDQSHMGREVKRLTGISPAKFNRLIETDESFWCYRLLRKIY
ncbi:MAG: helix-turn-helix domain-containing protein [Devosiaceae bacterium]|nr:helix-turn-helix domain-containing protein [Devosiaceae bacterium]